MKHPSAELAREEIAHLRFREAESVLRNALDAEPNHPDLICEALILQCYAMQERASARDFGRARGGVREKFLFKLLAEHFYCLTDLNSKLGRTDIEAVEYANRFPLTNPEGVGTNISAVLIVKNEEKMLAGCLESVKKVCSQIVVVDTGSNDRTVEIAEAFGATVGFYEWNRDFAAARNVSLSLATGEWALWIDADEALDPSSIDAIHKAIVRPHFGGFNVEIVNFVADDQQDEQFVHTLLRLFRRIPGVKFVEPIHEQVLPSLSQLGLPWAHLPGARLLHYGYQPSLMLEKNKTERTVSMVKARLEENPEDYFQWFNLANALVVARRFDECKEAARKCIFYMPWDVEFGPLVYQVLVTCHLELGEFDQALGVADQAKANDCGGILVEFEKANVFVKMGELERALEVVDATLNMDWPANLAGDKGIEIFKRHALKGQILSELGRFDEALEWMEQAIERAPNQPNLQLNKAIILDRNGDVPLAIEAYMVAAEMPKVRNDALRQLGYLYAREKDLARSAEALELAWQANTCDQDSWNGWVDCLTSLSKFEGVITAYEALTDVQPLDAEARTNFGRVLERVGLNGRALDEYTEAATIDPGYANAFFCRGDLLYRLGRYSDAAGCYQSGLGLNPVYDEGWFVFGNSLAQMNFNEAAQKCYEEVLRINPAHNGARHNLSIVAA